MKPLRVDLNSGKTDAYGNAGILSRTKLALLCSQKCPGDVILKSYDFARLVRDWGVPKTGREKNRDACQGKGS
jgi:hypothetical protein